MARAGLGRACWRRARAHRMPADKGLARGPRFPFGGVLLRAEFGRRTASDDRAYSRRRDAATTPLAGAREYTWARTVTAGSSGQLVALSCIRTVMRMDTTYRTLFQTLGPSELCSVSAFPRCAPEVPPNEMTVFRVSRSLTQEMCVKS